MVRIILFIFTTIAEGNKQKRYKGLRLCQSTSILDFGTTEL